MLISVKFSGFFVMLNSMKMVPMSYVRMMGCCLMIALLMMLGCFTVVFGRMFQMLGSFVVMFNTFWHDISPSILL
jgi:hypothetical protein